MDVSLRSQRTSCFVDEIESSDEDEEVEIEDDLGGEDPDEMVVNE